ncbi:hypothetical protein AB0H29_19040 [Streptomyces thermolilacinus]
MGAAPPGSAGRPGGLLLGAAYSPEPAAVGSLQAGLRDAVPELGARGGLADAEAGAILQPYHQGGAANHHQVAVRLHLGRATCFRHLRRGPRLSAHGPGMTAPPGAVRCRGAGVPRGGAVGRCAGQPTSCSYAGRVRKSA